VRELEIATVKSPEATVFDEDRGPNEPAVSGGFGSHAFSHKGNGAT
jgi:hypothetical protein